MCPTRSAPQAPRRPQALEAHGDVRVDDWYWLRDRDDPEVLALLEAENAYTAERTAALEPLVDQVYGELLSHIELTDVRYPTPKGAWAYYARTVDGLEHAIHCRRPATSPPPPVEPGSRQPPVAPADADEVVLLDENALAAGHDYFDLADLELSPDQRLAAYAIDTTGGERFTIKVRDLEAGRDLNDVVEGAYYGLAFSADGAVIFYTRPDATMRPFQVWAHRLGEPTEGDRLVFSESDERYFVGVTTTKDGAYVVITADSNSTSEVHLLDAADPAGEPRLVAARRPGVEYAVEHHHGELLILSDDDAVNFAVYRAPAATPAREHWVELVAHRDDVRLESMDVIEGHLLLHERGHASTAVRVVELATGAETVLDPPNAAGAVFLAESLEFSTSKVRYASTSLVDPLALHVADLATGEAGVVWRQPVPGYDPELYVTERIEVRAEDGTDVPVTLALRADRPAGPGPLLLYGYGAYEHSIDPVFSAQRSILPLLDRGGCYAIAHVRGGGELARAWYLAGKLEHKRNSFTDFVSCARALVERGLTTPRQLAALGASAGGLLVAAAANLAPEAFGAVVALVPFVDVVTTMSDDSLPLTANEWEEWGDPITSPEAYRWMKAYSPYDNVAAVRYPLLLVTGGLNDPRVSFFEPAKWVQKLRAAHGDNAERVLLKMQMSAGHAGPSGRYRSWREWAFELAFVLSAIGAA